MRKVEAARDPHAVQDRTLDRRPPPRLGGNSDKCRLTQPCSATAEAPVPITAPWRRPDNIPEPGRIQLVRKSSSPGRPVPDGNPWPQIRKLCHREDFGRWPRIRPATGPGECMTALHSCRVESISARRRAGGRPSGVPAKGSLDSVPAWRS